MVTPQGFNALLKLVEEPPPHIKFIFATTEPEKVIGTIRSRTHHYPFRLVSPHVLTDYLGKVAQSEGVTLDRGVLPLVIRAGGGSVRDSLSVLDQLIAGSGGTSVDYTAAVGLLGYTHAALLDETVDAIAGRDGAAVFNVIDRVIGSGHEPRRFVEDLLERLRDLIIIAAAPREADAVLRSLPADQLTRMKTQAEHLGFEALATAADLTNTALTMMVGATAPRMHLELLAARLLLAAGPVGAKPSAAPADHSSGERTETPSGPETAAAAAEVASKPAVAATAKRPSEPAPAQMSEGTTTDEAAVSRHLESVPASERTSAPDHGPDAQPEYDPPAPESAAIPAPVPTAAEEQAAEPAASSDAPEHVTASMPDASGDTGFVRSRWNEVLVTLRDISKVTWILVDQNAAIRSVTSDEVVLAFVHPAHAERFASGPDRGRVETALRESLGLTVRVSAVVDGAPAEPTATIPTEWEPAASASAQPAAATPPATSPDASTNAPPTSATSTPAVVPAGEEAAASASALTADSADLEEDESDLDDDDPGFPIDPEDEPESSPSDEVQPDADIVVSDDVDDLEGSTELLTGIELIKKELGGRIVSES